MLFVDALEEVGALIPSTIDFIDVLKFPTF